MSTFAGHIQDNTFAGGFPPGPAPSPVRIGRTLFVSSLGVDATAVREDFVFHFLTLDAALTAAQSGDLIVLYPGAYTCSNPLGLSVVSELTIFAHPGVSITGAPLFVDFLEGFTLSGYADLICTGGGSGSSLIASGLNINVNIQCNSFFSQDSSLVIGGSGIFCKFEVFDAMFFTGATYGLAFSGNGMIDPNNITVKGKRFIGMNTAAFFGPHYNITFLTGLTNVAGSRVWLEFEQYYFTGAANYEYPFSVSGTPGGDFNYHITIKGNIYFIDGPPIEGAGLWVQYTNTLDASVPDAGVYFYGNVIVDDDHNGIGLRNGKIFHIGDIKTENGSCVLLDQFLEAALTSTYIHNGGTLYSKNGFGIEYDAPQHMAILKDSKIITPAASIEGPAASTYQCLSVYAQTAPNVNVTNIIAATTIIVDAQITE